MAPCLSAEIRSTLAEMGSGNDWGINLDGHMTSCPFNLQSLSWKSIRHFLLVLFGCEIVAAYFPLKSVLVLLIKILGTSLLLKRMLLFYFILLLGKGGSIEHT